MQLMGKVSKTKDFDEIHDLLVELHAYRCTGMDVAEVSAMSYEARARKMMCECVLGDRVPESDYKTELYSFHN